MKTSIAKHKISVLQAQELRTQRLVEAGKNTIGELLQVQAQIAEARTELLSARTRREMAGLEIYQLLEIDDYNSFKVVSPKMNCDLQLIRKELDKQTQQALIDMRMAWQNYHASQKMS